MASDSSLAASTAKIPQILTDALETTPLLRQDDDIGLICKSEEGVSATTMFWQEMKTIPQYALPVFGSQILDFSMVFVPVISIGHMSTTSLAAISLGSMTANVTGLSVLQGLASALDTLLPSAYTSPQPHLVGLWAQRMAVVMVFSLLPIALLWLNAERILLGLRQDPEVAHLAAIYLRWFLFGLPAFAYNCISRRYFQSQGLFYVQTRIMSFVAPINVVLNYLLVWGPEPIRLGFIGAPIASALSFYLVSATSLIHGIYLIPHTAWHPLSMEMFTNLPLLVSLGLSGIAQVVSEWWAWEFVALAASFLGPITLAAQSVLITSAATAYQLSFAIASATAIRVGNLLGERNAKRAGVAAKTSMVVSFLAALITSTIFIVFRKSWAKLFNDDPIVANIVAGVIPLIAFFQVIDANSAVTAAILRARGQQFIGALLNLSGYYVIGLPVGAFLTFKWNMGLNGLWLGLTASLVYCSVIGTLLCLKTDWYEEVERVIKRNAEEDKLRKVSDEERDV